MLPLSHAALAVPHAVELPFELQESGVGLAEFESLGSPLYPSWGSKLHASGQCKPCAFVFKDGCQSGINCNFCHLCDPGAKKRRKKERRLARKEANANAW